MFWSFILRWRTAKLAGLEILKQSSFIQHGETTGTTEEFECETKKPPCQYAIERKTNDEESFTLDGVDDIHSKEETLSNSDNLEVESGVESATGDLIEAELLELGFTPDLFEIAGENLSDYIQLGDLDLTTEQAQETLKYFSEYYFLITSALHLYLEWKVKQIIFGSSRRIDKDLLWLKLIYTIHKYAYVTLNCSIEPNTKILGLSD